MGTKPPSDLSPSWVEEEASGPQLRSHQCSSCKRSLAACLCATPSTSSGTPSRRSRPKKRSQQSNRPVESPGGTRRQLFKEATTDNVKDEVISESEPGPSGREEETRASEEGEETKPLGKTRHTCPHCPKSFGSPGKLSQHLYAHTGERPFVCQHCNKAFSSRFKLVRHTLIHSDQRQYRCHVCERTFHRKDHLKNHSKVHSLTKRRYKCDREGCGKEYSSPISYRKHVAVHAAEDGNLQCTICGKTCSTKEEIVTHLKIHAGSRTVKTQADRKYRCELCDRSFYTGKDVRRHLVVHTGKRDFLCQFCPQRFGRKDHLVRHIKKSHNHTGKKGKKRPEPRTKTVTAIMEEASTSRIQDMVEEVKSESSSPFGMFDDEEDTNLPSTSGEIFKTKDLGVRFSQSEEMLSETSGSMMSDNVYQSPPPPYPLSGLPSTMTFDPGTTSEVIDIKPEVMSEYITLLPHQFQGSLPPNLLLTTEDTSDPLLMPSGHFIEPVEESSLHRQFLQMPNYIAPQTSQSSSSGNDLIISEFISSSEAPTSSTPLPRFNQAFHQPP
ncbi:zinc finger protein PLAG1-like [Homalodisca vitripennis]|uniref:C2H2-type domain-containing protein n=1 Tax=Homalodisca liturata TaxID=320908 RepID=A0A1B6JA51_9HEMI|nr:zinc finger protein PLAG1-like [Homalodisca vitripennis]XP_046681872.1 zinc finger protein PLAG1-like [Homalodisca vitripennis]XP_046681880.1 zinc finger protein PLAG1-like [Homalodisca vitripennis]XP_046681891.1 zinc finger protein PLAG1-like [Homalodisca vitripennis]